jgi:hypothetical protein
MSWRETLTPELTAEDHFLDKNFGDFLFNHFLPLQCDAFLYVSCDELKRLLLCSIPGYQVF